LSERYFPSSERATDPDPGLKNDNANCCEMQNSKPRISHPGPVGRFPDKNQCQAEHYERDEQHVTEKKRIRGQKKQEIGLHFLDLSLELTCTKYLARRLWLQASRQIQ
jgi:hypothetical protein